mmetsp:Transcript_30680/g.98882  ORF Transcript_30680/g.98882 Transcript_30680/m.98882 type:complete len:234 (+) Transcript_30680:114-815(+)
MKVPVSFAAQLVVGKRLHYSSEAQTAIDAEQLKLCGARNTMNSMPRSTVAKPLGLWYDYPTMPCGGDGWRAFCHQFGGEWLEKVRWANEVEVDEAQIYKIETEGDLMRFLLDWCSPAPPRWKMFVSTEKAREQVLERDPTLASLFDQVVQEEKLYNAKINFFLLKREYSGLEISPYVYDSPWRFASEWLNSWDCSSGVIWDEKAFVNFGDPQDTSEWPPPAEFTELGQHRTPF